MIFNIFVKNPLTKEQLFDRIQVQEQTFGKHVRPYAFKERGFTDMSRDLYRMRVLLIVVIAAAAVLICGFFISSSHRAYGAQTSDSQICYESYVVESGDTLWSIADRFYESSFASREDYIREVMRVNELQSTHIYEGDLIAIPTSGISVQLSAAGAD